jgi:hypothetical protein
MFENVAKKLLQYFSKCSRSIYGVLHNVYVGNEIKLSKKKSYIRHGLASEQIYYSKNGLMESGPTNEKQKLLLGILAFHSFHNFVETSIRHFGGLLSSKSFISPSKNTATLEMSLKTFTRSKFHIRIRLYC